MPSWAFPALLLVAAVTVTYFSCVRPMLKGKGHCAGQNSPGADGDAVGREIAALREELRILRAEDSLQQERKHDIS